MNKIIDHSSEKQFSIHGKNLLKKHTKCVKSTKSDRDGDNPDVFDKSDNEDFDFFGKSIILVSKSGNKIIVDGNFVDYSG